jgi:hypothetical protein
LSVFRPDGRIVCLPISKVAAFYRRQLHDAKKKRPGLRIAGWPLFCGRPCITAFALTLSCCSENAYIPRQGLASGGLQDTMNDHEHGFHIG